MAGCRVLILDDETDFANFVARVAEGMGHLVKVTLVAKDFVQAVTDFDPDVIVIDVVMPDIDGLELINWLADIRSRARIVIVTGYNPLYARMGEVMAQAKGILSVTVRQKPVALDDLRSVLAID